MGWQMQKRRLKVGKLWTWFVKDSLPLLHKVATGAGNTGAQGGAPNPFQDPNLLERLRNHHKTKDYLDDPSFMKILKELQKDPEALLR